MKKVRNSLTWFSQNLDRLRHEIGKEAKKQTERVKRDRSCRDVHWWHWTVHEESSKRVGLPVEGNLQKAVGEISDGGDRHIEAVIHGERWDFKGLHSSVLMGAFLMALRGAEMHKAERSCVCRKSSA